MSIIANPLSALTSVIRSGTFSQTISFTGDASETISSANGVKNFTDANVFFEPIVVKALVYNLIAKEAQLVCGNILKFSPKNNGISGQEIFYMNFENQLKYNESLKYGFCVGVEGGCYGILKQQFVKVPDGFLMDDFFITLDVISKNGKVLFEPEAISYEDVNDDPMIEFSRKIRISLGNFRNLKFYKISKSYRC